MVFRWSSTRLLQEPRGSLQSWVLRSTTSLLSSDRTDPTPSITCHLTVLDSPLPLLAISVSTDRPGRPTAVTWRPASPTASGWPPGATGRTTQTRATSTRPGTEWPSSTVWTTSAGLGRGLVEGRESVGLIAGSTVRTTTTPGGEETSGTTSRTRRTEVGVCGVLTNIDRQ